MTARVWGPVAVVLIVGLVVGVLVSARIARSQFEGTVIQLPETDGDGVSVVVEVDGSRPVRGQIIVHAASARCESGSALLPGELTPGDRVRARGVGEVRDALQVPYVEAEELTVTC